MSLTTKIRRKRHPISGPYIIGRQKLYWAIRRATALMYGLQLWSFMKWQRIKNYFRQLPTMRCCINTWEHLAPRPGQWWRSLHSKTPITSGRTFSEDTFVRKIIRWVYLIPYFYIMFIFGCKSTNPTIWRTVILFVVSTSRLRIWLRIDSPFVIILRHRPKAKKYSSAEIQNVGGAHLT